MYASIRQCILLPESFKAVRFGRALQIYFPAYPVSTVHTIDYSEAGGDGVRKPPVICKQSDLH